MSKRLLHQNTVIIIIKMTNTAIYSCENGTDKNVKYIHA